MNGQTELFLDKYKQLEAVIKAKAKLRDTDSAIKYILAKPEYREAKEGLDYCRQVRNLLTHNPKVDGRYAVQPNEAMIALLGEIIEKVRNPLRAKHIYIPRSNVLCRTMKDKVYPTMAEMKQRGYTHIPILQNGVVTGVFSENTVFNYLIENTVVRIDEKVTFGDIAKYLPIDAHGEETFRFVSKEALLDEIEEVFAEGRKKKERIGLVFVTHSGKPTEKLLGIISAWDVAAY